MGKRAFPLVVPEAAISSPDPDPAVTVAVQAAVIVELRAVIAEQARVIEVLTARVAELERQLGKHSRNSSKPPSSDGLGKPAASGRQRRAGGRRPGKQPGAPGAHLAPVADPDAVVWHRPQRCQGCGLDLTLAPVTGVQARQVVDLPEIRLSTTEHRAEGRVCGCGQITWARFPAQARAAVCYGAGVRALGCYLLAAQHLPIERAAELLGVVVGQGVSAGTLAGLLGEAAGGLELGGFAERVRALVATAPVVHFDETGARVAGRLHWVHSASTALLSWFTMHAKRGVEAMDAAGILPGFGGVAVHDCWSPYWHYDTAVHALCVAHLLRELEEAAAWPGQGWAGELAEWLSVACSTAARARAAGAARLDPAILVGLLGRYSQIIAKGHAANPPPTRTPGSRGRPKRPAAVCLLERLDTHRDQVCRFLEDLRVPPTNNQAERDIRMVKLQQKISGCWRTLPGAQAFLLVRSYIATARKHGLNPMVVLRQLFEGNAWLPAPSPT